MLASVTTGTKNREPRSFESILDTKSGREAHGYSQTQERSPHDDVDFSVVLDRIPSGLKTLGFTPGPINSGLPYGSARGSQSPLKGRRLHYS